MSAKEPDTAAPEGSRSAEDARSAQEIRADIDATRDELGDTYVAKAKGSSGKTDDATAEDTPDAASRLTARIKANPLPVGVVLALLIGLLVGRMGSR